MIENLIVPKDFVQVDEASLTSVLSNTGNRGFGYFRLNDDIKVGTTVFDYKRPVLDGNRKPTFDENGKPVCRSVYYIECTRNGKPTLAPMSAFRHFPHEIDAFLTEAPQMRDLSEGDDASRYALIAGKHLKVTKIFDGTTRDWALSPSGTPSVDIKYRPSKFAIFDFLD